MAADNRLCIISVGHRHVTAMIAEVRDQLNPKVVALHRIDSEGLQHGRVTDAARLSTCIKRVISSVESASELRVHSAWLVFSHPELISSNVNGQVEILSGRVEVTDCVRAFSAAKQKVLTPETYVVNHMLLATSLSSSQQAQDEHVVTDPIGMYAQRMSRFHHIMRLPVADVQNLQDAMQRAHVGVEQFLLSNFAASEYALLPEERQQGCCVVDIGYHTTSISCHVGDVLIHSSCLPLGAGHVTEDLVIELGINRRDAEELKRLHGTVDLSQLKNNQSVQAGRAHTAIRVDRHHVCQIIEARYNELLMAVLEDLQVNEVDHVLQNGIVFCGGGSLINGFTNYAHRLYGWPVHLANFPDRIETQSAELMRNIKRPCYQPLVGALLYSTSEHFIKSSQSEESKHELSWFERMSTGMIRVSKRFIQFLKEIF